ncbi:25121_t:CDS:2 [Cetraspora pellucida]|uniref:25121_t:CDS:1 n=1 Tax=Cetraspora pellucida TaxID=1433469 RepID=A0A9N9EKD4_9GLOM|nr:25121_t:CDS:2 [Cetraspora pellucida]
MLLPSSKTYNTANKLFQNAQTFTNSQDYALVKKKTQKDVYSELKNMTIYCNQGGVYNNLLGFSKETNNKKKALVHNAEHNHSLSEDMLGHPIIH